MKYIIFLLALIIVGLPSCTRKENCAKINISGSVKHHGKLIPSAMVYIKKGSKDSPADARNPNSYDQSVRAGSDASYSFSDLEKGDYYLFAIGYDDGLADSVYGGAPLTIECKPQTETLTTQIAVVE